MALRVERHADADADRDLVIAAQDAAAAFTPLYRRYVAPVYAYCARRLQDRARAEDATSTVFTNALTAIRGFDPAKGTFRSWLFTIAHNVVVSDFRAIRPVDSLDSVAEIPGKNDGPEEHAIAMERRDELMALLDRLPPEQRDVIELRLIGLKGAEIAAVLGRSHAAVKVAQHRAIRRLRETLSERDGLEVVSHDR